MRAVIKSVTIKICHDIGGDVVMEGFLQCFMCNNTKYKNNLMLSLTTNMFDNQNVSLQDMEGGRVFFRVTTISKLLTLILFITLPFIGFWLGYVKAPPQIVEVEKIVTKEVLVEQIEPTKVPKNDLKVVEVEGLYTLFSVTVNESGSCGESEYKLDYGDGKNSWFKVFKNYCKPRTILFSHNYSPDALEHTYSVRLHDLSDINYYEPVFDQVENPVMSTEVKVTRAPYIDSEIR